MSIDPLISVLRIGRGAEAHELHSARQDFALPRYLLAVDRDPRPQTLLSHRNGETTGDQVPRPETGESTAPLTEEQIATLVELVRADRRDDYDFLCAALGVTNGPGLWAGVKHRVASSSRLP